MAKPQLKKMPNFGQLGFNSGLPPVDFSKIPPPPSNKGSSDPFPYPEGPAQRPSENMSPAGRHFVFSQGINPPVPSFQDIKGFSDPFPYSGGPAYVARPSENVNPIGRHSVFNQGVNSPVPSPEHPDQDNMTLAGKFMGKQFQEKIRPCIDLIDSLRSLGVEKDLALPAIAVIGDQSSGKSSVLEALSGVNLPRGTGIVTRCPLELKLKKSAQDSSWCGTISYGNKIISVQGPSAVEDAVRKAQDSIAGQGKGISSDLITLEIVSPNVPDLTLIDLPGIARIALPEQPRDIGKQIRKIIKEYISRQETINLAVVPSNVDIATTEVLEMAREVDPTGERTIGVLTKPDLVDVGGESEVVHVVQNLVYILRKGYMIVKCRGQREIQNNISLEEALHNEKTFFETHEHFSVLLKRKHATIPHLAERLTKELVYHISKSLPNIEQQIRSKLREAEEQLNRIGRGTPDTEDEKRKCLIEKIRDFNDGIKKVVEGDEEGDSEDLKLFRNLRKLFNSWEIKIKNSCAEFVNHLKKEPDVYEYHYRGRELIGFINYKKFENIMRKHIATFQEPAICLQRDVTELVHKCFRDVASKYFAQFENLYGAAMNNIEDICLKQKQKAEGLIYLQFKMEKIIHCQDNLHSEALSAVRSVPQEEAQMFLNQLICQMEAYYHNAVNRLINQIPLIIQHYTLNEFKDHLENQMMCLLEDRDRTDLLEERDGLSAERHKLKDRIRRLNLARERLKKFKQV